MNSGMRNQEVIEDDPEHFWERFCAFAVEFGVAPEPLGSPLLEVITPLGTLYAFDRSLASYGSKAKGILHAQVQTWQSLEAEAPAPQSAIHKGGGRYELSGVVENHIDKHFFVLNAGTPPACRFVLWGEQVPEVGLTIKALLAPPLMVFREGK
jgi:hypothetical protein